MISFTWIYGQAKFEMIENGSFYTLRSNNRDVSFEIRNRIKDFICSSLPFSSTFTFSPHDAKSVFSFYLPKSIIIDEVVQTIQQIVVGNFKQIGLPKPIEMMLVPAERAGPKVRVDSMAPLNKHIQPLLEDDNRLMEQISLSLKVNELCLFHFLKKSLSREDVIVIKREIEQGNILSKKRWSHKYPLVSTKLGITGTDDKERNDDDYGHCFIGYPFASNVSVLKGRVNVCLSGGNLLQIAFTNRPGTIILPFDVEEIKSHYFNFLGKEYSILVNKNDMEITYKQESRKLMSHKFADETFLTDEHALQPGVNGLLVILSQFVKQLDDIDRQKIFQSKGCLLRELFNNLFLFRTQVSFPGELPYQEFSDSDQPKVKIERLINEPIVYLTDLKAYASIFKKLYAGISESMPVISKKVKDELLTINKFFTSRFHDGVNSYRDAFAYFGGTSAQLLIHFSPEIKDLFTSEVLIAIMQIHKFRNKEAKELYEGLLLIKRTGNTEISLFSLIEFGLNNLDPIQLRTPPNLPFNTSKDAAELAYLEQLKSIYLLYTPLICNLCHLSNEKAPEVEFLQSNHIEQTLARGIERLIYPISYDPEAFSNVHNYCSSGFFEEFDRGINQYFNSFELMDNRVVHSHVVDFVRRFVDGCTLLEPQFKHDILDLKHFIAGMTSNVLYAFRDAKVTFHELILRSLYEIKKQKKLTINGQLILDAVYLFLKTQKPTNSKNIVPDHAEMGPGEMGFLDKVLSAIIDENERAAIKKCTMQLIPAGRGEFWIRTMVDELEKIDNSQRDVMMSLILELVPMSLVNPALIRSLNDAKPSSWKPILEAIKNINCTGYDILCIPKLIDRFSFCDEQSYPFIVQCVNLLQFQIKKEGILWLGLCSILDAILHRVIQRKLDYNSEQYITLIP